MNVISTLKSLLRKERTDIDAGRAHERRRKILLANGTSVLFRIFSAASLLLLYPLFTHQYGTEQFGIWMTINSFSMLLIFTDLGIGNGLLSAIADSSGKNDDKSSRSYSSSAFFILLAISILLGSMFFALLQVVDLHGLIPSSDLIIFNETKWGLIAFIALFLFRLPTSSFNRIRTGYQENHFNQLWETVGVILGFVGATLCLYLKIGMHWFIFLFYLGPVVSDIFNGSTLFIFSQPHTTPRPWFITRESVIFLFKAGFVFLICQAVWSITIGCDNLIIAHTLGQNAVAEYSAVKKLFEFPNNVLLGLAFPLWPAFTEALSRKDIHWIRSTLRKVFKYVLGISLLVNGLLVLFGPAFIRIWFSGKITPERTLFIYLAIYWTVVVIGSTLTMLLNGLKKIRIHAIIGSITCAFTVFAKFKGAQFFGETGLLLFGSGTYLVFLVVPAYFYLIQFIRKLETEGTTTHVD